MVQPHDGALVEVELQPILKPGNSPGAEDNHKGNSLRRALGPTNYELMRTTAYVGLLICIWYFLSTCLNLWNRKFVGQGHGVFGLGPFPAPMLMSSLQFCWQLVIAELVMRVGIAKRKNPERLSWQEYFREVVPNGVATGLDIGLSNFSLSLITLSFYTMCKSTSPVFLLLFAFLWKIERPSLELGAVVAIISAGLLLVAYGETAFNVAGFVLVLTASALSGLRWTITQALLTMRMWGGVGASGGPVEVLMSLLPVMAITLGVVSVLIENLQHVLPRSPYFQTVGHCAFTAMLMGLGAIIAFLMVWVEFTVIAETSALTFMVAGTFKEIVTVIAAVLFLGEEFSAINALGLFVLIMGVFLYNYHRYRKILSGQAKAPAPRARVSEAPPKRAGAAGGSGARDGDVEDGGPRPGSQTSTPTAASLSAALELGGTTHRAPGAAAAP